MTTSQHREVAAAHIIDTRGRFPLQQRDNIPGTLIPGKIGLFGGHREGNETFLECASGKSMKKSATSYHQSALNTSQVSEGPTHPYVAGGTLSREFYVIRDVPVEPLRLTDGTLFVAEMKVSGAMEKYPRSTENCPPSWREG